jgi:hypothetical protein
MIIASGYIACKDGLHLAREGSDLLAVLVREEHRPWGTPMQYIYSLQKSVSQGCEIMTLDRVFQKNGLLNHLYGLKSMTH